MKTDVEAIKKEASKIKGSEEKVHRVDQTLNKVIDWKTKEMEEDREEREYRRLKLEVIKNEVANASTFEDKVKELEKKLVNIDKSVDMVINTKVREYQVEKEDELKRSLNLILFGIPESANDDGNDKKEDDKRIITGPSINDVTRFWPIFDPLPPRHTSSQKVRPPQIWRHNALTSPPPPEKNTPFNCN